MSYGMSYDEFWNGDVHAVKYYREYNDKNIKTTDARAWLQGSYVYNAILCASPILHDYVKAGTQPQPYLEKPYTLMEHKNETNDKLSEKEIENERLKFIVMMNNFTRRSQRQFGKRKEK